MKNRSFSFRLLMALSAIILLFSACGAITEPLLNKKKVVLIGPSDGAVTSDSAQVFLWNRLTDSASYELQIVSPNFDTIDKVVIDTVINNNQFSKVLTKGKFAWRVKAMNFSSSSQYSDIWSFMIQ